MGESEYREKYRWEKTELPPWKPSPLAALPDTEFFTVPLTRLQSGLYATPPIHHSAICEGIGFLDDGTPAALFRRVTEPKEPKEIG